MKIAAKMHNLSDPGLTESVIARSYIFHSTVYVFIHFHPIETHVSCTDLYRSDGARYKALVEMH